MRCITAMILACLIPTAQAGVIRFVAKSVDKSAHFAVKTAGKTARLAGKGVSKTASAAGKVIY